MFGKMLPTLADSWFVICYMVLHHFRYYVIIHGSLADMWSVNYMLVVDITLLADIFFVT